MVEVVYDDTVYPSREQKVDSDTGSSSKRFDVSIVNIIDVKQVRDIAGYLPFSSGIPKGRTRSVG